MDSYERDSASNVYLESPLGWDDSDAYVRTTLIESAGTIRISKVQGKVYPGPEVEIKHIPELVENLMKIYNAYKDND